ncbi:serine aminopeptidase S33 family [Stella humosa]|uniref:Serine aminopeptidase S33 family n=2 Tax=Stella humosa TaxID=94 RepID=A0A3N1M254_9PROT|nr:serine aminopeptidase S33 family [Stella humosa]BBK31975.1 alpha/beta hydrolase [Stella humosa]
MTRSDAHFTSGGERCDAWLYLPDGPGPHPCIVFAHGIGAIRQVRVGAYAEHFTRAGYAVFAFDYRGWGTSEGNARILCDISGQHADIHAAIDHVGCLDMIDPGKVVLFGTSFGGGHAVAVGATRPGLAAVIAQCAVVDGLAAAIKAPPVLAFRWMLAGLADQVRGLFGGAPYYIKLAAEPGQLALMTAPGAEASYQAMIEGPSPWRNLIGARFVLRIPFYRPIRQARRIQAKLLMIVTDRDEITPSAVIAKVARLAPRGEAVHFDAGHFDIYFGDLFDKAIIAMLAFLATTPAAPVAHPGSVMGRAA